MGKIIDGKAMAAAIREELKERVAAIKARGTDPCLAVVLVGGDEASKVYVRHKAKDCEEVGIASVVERIEADIAEGKLIEKIKTLNSDKKIHGIIVQLPLPKGLDEKRVLSFISPAKDVDGFHAENAGKLFKGEEPLFLPCTPAGIMEMILSTGIEIKGKEAVVVGRSNIVGKPVAVMLLDRHATVTLCHSRTADLGGVVRRGDIVVAAVGKAGIIGGEMIKPGAVVIDVGMNRTDKGLAGDVDFDKAKEVASYITPVPGGVGPMTRAMLLMNTVTAAERALKGR